MFFLWENFSTYIFDEIWFFHYFKYPFLFQGTKMFKKIHWFIGNDTLSIQLDRTERHDLKSQLWLFFFPFHFPQKKGKKKRRMNSIIVILSHAFLLDHSNEAVMTKDIRCLKKITIWRRLQDYTIIQREIKI